MAGAWVGSGKGGWRSALTSPPWLHEALPALLYGIRLWAAVCLALYVAFALELDNPSWAGASAAIVCQPVLGASLRKGWFRLVGTVIGAVFAVFLTACFPSSRAGFLIGLAFWGAACALVATLLRNFASYAAALSGYTAAIIASDELGAVGGVNGDAFNLAVTRGTEIGIGIVCAGMVLALTDLGGAHDFRRYRRRLHAGAVDQRPSPGRLAGRAAGDHPPGRRARRGHRPGGGRNRHPAVSAPPATGGGRRPVRRPHRMALCRQPP